MGGFHSNSLNLIFFFLLACESHQAATSESSTYALGNTNPGTNGGAFIKKIKLCDLNMGR